MLIRRRAEAAGIGTRIGCHSFRATGITTYLKNGGRLEIAQHMANHESPRTTSLRVWRPGLRRKACQTASLFLVASSSR